MDDLLVFGVGHSGTTIVTRMFHAMGWNTATENSFYEPMWCVSPNGMLVREMTGNQRPDDWPVRECVDFIESSFRGVKKPYCLKDPRFSITLSYFSLDVKLIHVTRNFKAVRQSYLRRKQTVNGVAGVYGMTLEELLDISERNLDAWRGEVVRVKYEDIAENIGDLSALSEIMGHEVNQEAASLWQKR